MLSQKLYSRKTAMCVKCGISTCCKLTYTYTDMGTGLTGAVCSNLGANVQDVTAGWNHVYLTIEIC